MSSPFTNPRQAPPQVAGPRAMAVESGTRLVVRGGVRVARSALRGLGRGIQALREESQGASPQAAQRRVQLAAELEEARRLGRWHTAEDEALVREHEARLAAERRSQWLRRAGQRGTVALLVVAWIVPVLWPVAIFASFTLFPRTSRRVLLGLLGLGAASLLALALVVGQWLRGDEPSTGPALPASGLGQPGDAELGRGIADRLVREADYWEVVTPSQEGPGMLRKGVFRTWRGQPVMVIPRSSWQALTSKERRALVEHLRFERGVAGLHVGRIEPSSRFQGNAITVEERVWP